MLLLDDSTLCAVVTEKNIEGRADCKANDLLCIWNMTYSYISCSIFTDSKTSGKDTDYKNENNIVVLKGTPIEKSHPVPEAGNYSAVFLNSES